MGRKYTTVKLPMTLVKEVQMAYGTTTATRAVIRAMEERLSEKAWERIMSRGGRLKNMRYVREEEWAGRDTLVMSPQRPRKA